MKVDYLTIHIDTKHCRPLLKAAIYSLIQKGELPTSKEAIWLEAAAIVNDLMDTNKALFAEHLIATIFYRTAYYGAQTNVTKHNADTTQIGTAPLLPDLIKQVNDLLLADQTYQDFFATVKIPK